ncbi:hypothetical protein ABZ397_06350 [Streptomyces sp. NPDC005876]|uniref:hypothetical protein n=1 Tax=Streptomyces sp. NPDC005876 TaxID=3157076 RepID=UPI0033FF911C
MMYGEESAYRPHFQDPHPLGTDDFPPGDGRHRAPAPEYAPPPLVPDMTWDPAEELAFLLQDALAEQRPDVPPPPGEAPAAAPAPGSPLGNLQEITTELPPLRDAAHSHRKVRERRGPRGLDAVSYLTAALVTVIASAVSLLSGVVAYDPLRVVAVTRLQSGVVSWWPLLVFGPWLVASLSVLRAALHQRRAVHSWCVVLVFSLISVFLCVVQAPGTVIDIAAAALPGLASLACFQQLVRQVTLTRPPRRTAPRHRAGNEPEQPAEEEKEFGAVPDAEVPEAVAPPGPRPPRPVPQRAERTVKTYVISDNRRLRHPDPSRTGPVPQPRRAH